jgi:hypothetical protein
MISKEALLKTLQEMPEQINVEDLLQRIILLQKIETGLAQSDNRNVISTDELKKEILKWSK